MFCAVSPYETTDQNNASKFKYMSDHEISMKHLKSLEIEFVNHVNFVNLVEFELQKHKSRIEVLGKENESSRNENAKYKTMIETLSEAVDQAY